MILKNKKLIYVAAAGFALLIAIALPKSISSRGKGAVRSAVAPMERGTAGVARTLSETLSAVRGIGGTAEENRQLRLDLIRLQSELDSLRGVEADNIRLRQAFDFQKTSSFSIIPCDVISRNINGWWNSVRIGKGYNKGIQKNHAVISPDGLVGKTTEPSADTCEVLLVCDPACRVSAKIKDKNIFGLVRGCGTNIHGQPLARIDFIDKDAEIKVGDPVVTSGLSGNNGAFPKGVHIGYIVKSEKDKSGLYQYAELAPSATVSLLDYIFVVSKKPRKDTLQ